MIYRKRLRRNEYSPEPCFIEMYALKRVGGVDGDCGKVLGFPQFSGSAPAPAPPGTRTAAEEEPASALRLVPSRSLKKEMKFLLTERTA